MSEPVTSKLKQFRVHTTSGRIVLAILCGGMILTAVGYYFFSVYVPPFKSLGGLALGMKKVDVTLAYSSRPDSEISIAPATRDLVYGNTTVRLRGQGDEARVDRVCTSDLTGGSFHVRDVWLGVVTPESRVIQALGTPTHVSVNEEGTATWATFGKHNAAFEFNGGLVKQLCVTRRPVRFQREYRSE